MKHQHEIECDKCGCEVKPGQLLDVPFHYLDRNDKHHPDLGGGYRAYKVCKFCFRRGV